MAKVINNRRCVVCGFGPVQMWTIDNMQNVVVTYLCKEHGAPLLEIMELAGDLTPDEQVPVPEREPVPTRVRRESKMAPLLDWTPPPRLPAPPAG